MITAPSRISTAVALGMGVVLGWGLGSCRPAPLHAGASDRSGESIVASGPVMNRYDETTKSSVPQDAIYFLDYKGGRLLSTIPSLRQTGTASQLLDTFIERDLVADFKLDLGAGPRPHFLMTTGSLGAYNAGWSPLYVFETTSSQVAVYRMQVPQTVGTVTQLKLDLLEIRSYARAGTSDLLP